MIRDAQLSPWLLPPREASHLDVVPTAGDRRTKDEQPDACSPESCDRPRPSGEGESTAEHSRVELEIAGDLAINRDQIIGREVRFQVYKGLDCCERQRGRSIDHAYTSAIPPAAVEPRPFRQLPRPRRSGAGIYARTSS